MPFTYQSKRFVRDRLTHKLLTSDGRWTSEEAAAHQFVSLNEVLETCRLYGVTNGELLLRYADVETTTPICLESGREQHSALTGIPPASPP